MRRYLMECIGSFFLTLAFTLRANDPITLGLMLIGLMYIGYHISGAQYNPAISIGMLLRRGISLNCFFIYIGMQFLGALLGMGFQYYLLEQTFSPEAISAIDPSKVFFAELLLSAFFVLVYLTVTTLSQFKTTPVYATAVGLAFMAICLTGGIFNPAFVAATWLFNFVAGVAVDWREMVVYTVAPLIGGMLAAVAYDFFNHGPSHHEVHRPN